jgi:four helix bundle protein
MYHSYENLEVWKRSVDVAVRLYSLLENCRDYGIKDQMLRSAVSVPSNIAEGAERDSKRDFVRFLRISKGSAAELRTQLHIADRAKIVSAAPCAEIRSEVAEISRMLQGLVASLRRGSGRKASPASNFKLETSNSKKKE